MLPHISRPPSGWGRIPPQFHRASFPKPSTPIAPRLNSRSIQPIVPSREYSFVHEKVSPTLRKVDFQEHHYKAKGKQEFKKLKEEYTFTRANVSQLTNIDLVNHFGKIFLPSEMPESTPHLREETKQKVKGLEDEFVVKTSSKPEVIRAKRALGYCEAHPSVIEGRTKIMFGGAWPPATAKEKREYGHVFDPEVKDLDILEKRNQLKVEKHQKFLSELNDIIKNNKGNKHTVEALVDYMYDEKAGGLERFTADELNRLLVQLWNHHGEDAIVEMMISSNNALFKRDPLSLEILGKSALKSQTYFSPFVAISVANILLERDPNSVEAHALLAETHQTRFYFAREMYKNLLNQEINEETQELYEKCFGYEESIDIQKVRSNIEDTLTLSLHYNQIAFRSSFDPKYGLKVMLTELELENINHPKNAPGHAQITAELIQTACLRDDVLFSRNLPIVTAFVEASYISGKHDDILPKIEAQLLTLCKTLKDTEATIKSIETLHRLAPTKEAEKQSEQLLDKLINHFNEMKTGKEHALKALEDRQKEYAAIKLDKTPETIGWNLKTYSYEGQTSNVIEGNLMSRGGQLPSHEINRYTKAYFTKILETPLGELIDKLPPKVEPSWTLLDLDDVDLQMDLFDRFLRVQFKTEELQMETLDSPGHKKYDSVVNGSLKIRGVRENRRKEIKDDRTNLAYHMHTRLGDCRQNAQSKQLLFNLLREAQINKQLSLMAEAFDNEDFESYENAKLNIDILMSKSLKLWEMEIGYGDPQHFNKIESHVTNVLISSDEKGNADHISIRDAFYQNEYPFKNSSIDFKGKNPAKDIFVVGKYKAKDGKEYDLLVKSARYAGPKDKYDKSNNQNHFIGLPEPLYSFDDTLKMRKQIDDRHNDILLWNELDEFDIAEKAKAAKEKR